MCKVSIIIPAVRLLKTVYRTPASEQNTCNFPCSEKSECVICTYQISNLSRENYSIYMTTEIFLQLVLIVCLQMCVSM